MKTHSWAVWACALAIGPNSAGRATANPAAASPPQQEAKASTVAFTQSGATACTNCHVSKPARQPSSWADLNVYYSQLTDVAIDGTARFYLVANPEDEILGATLLPVTEPLRAQLNLVEGQGLLVDSLVEGGPASKAGLQRYDIVLSLNDQPLSNREQFQEKLKASADQTLKLGLVRGREKTTLTARPITIVTLGPAAAQQAPREYFIGVNLEPLDEPLRVNLGLKEGEGVLIKDVLDSSPAASAGLKAYDVALKLAGEPVESVEAFRARIQNQGEKEAVIEGLRGGKPYTIKVTPATRPLAENTFEGVRVFQFNQENTGAAFVSGVRQPAVCPVPHPGLMTTWDLTQQDRAKQAWDRAASASKENDDLRQELKALREAVERLEKALNAKK